MDHVIFHGPPGLGKTTLARIIAEELGVQFRTISAPVIARPGDLAAALVGMGERDVLFVDEIHRLPAAAEEMLYSAMEDFRSEEHTSELQSLMRISYAVFCLKKKNKHTT